jgi:pilus assembly protein CpaB
MLQGKYPLIIALVLGVMAGVIAYSAITAKEKAVRTGWAVKRVLCAQIDIDEGKELDEGSYNVCEIPEKFVTDSFITIGEEEGPESVVPYGQKLIVPLKKGDPILYSHFESRKEFPLAEAVAQKMRAFSIEVGEKSSVNQLIKPNDHVDVVGTFRNAEGTELVATTVLQNIIVLATGRTTGTAVTVSDDDKKYTHVALLVMPEDAEILALAAESGTLSLSLRNPSDNALEKRDGKQVTTVSTLFDGEKKNRGDEARIKAFALPKLPETPNVPKIIGGVKDLEQK